MCFYVEKSQWICNFRTQNKAEIYVNLAPKVNFCNKIDNMVILCPNDLSAIIVHSLQ
jgi:hypothetical protein